MVVIGLFFYTTWCRCVHHTKSSSKSESLSDPSRDLFDAAFFASDRFVLVAIPTIMSCGGVDCRLQWRGVPLYNGVGGRDLEVDTLLTNVAMEKKVGLSNVGDKNRTRYYLDISFLLKYIDCVTYVCVNFVGVMINKNQLIR